LGTDVLAPELLRKIDAYWRAANYLSVGQIYLRDNPLLKRPLALADVKRRLLGHWGTTPGQNFIYAHLNRVIRQYDLDMIFICGPGHGGPTVVANTYLEGSYSEIYPDITEDEAGLGKLFRQFSFPGGIPSHASPECPGSIHEGGELGYSLSHAFGAVFDNPDLVVACVIGDGEAETGPLATAWHSNKFLDPATDVRAAEAVALFCYQVRKCIGAFATVLCGVDTLVFSGGIGENSALIREQVCDGLGFLGIELDRVRNAADAALISAEAGRVGVRVIRTDEELMIAGSVARALSLGTMEDF
jgi:hypothetical protein